MEKLELKHIAPYLPYGLKCQCRDLGILELTSVSTINKDYQCWFESALDYNNRDFNYGILSRNSECGIGFNLDKIKPLLHPMSDLYKEIDGEIPADILFPKEYYSLIDFYEEYNRENQIQSFIKDGLNWCEPYSFWEYLLTKHFDIYGLIDKGLAIDINSISHE